MYGLPVFLRKDRTHILQRFAAGAVAPTVGLEPTTDRLTADSSTD